MSGPRPAAAISGTFSFSTVAWRRSSRRALHARRRADDRRAPRYARARVCRFAPPLHDSRWPGSDRRRAHRCRRDYLAAVASLRCHLGPLAPRVDRRRRSAQSAIARSLSADPGPPGRRARRERRPDTLDYFDRTEAAEYEASVLDAIRAQKGLVLVPTPGVPYRTGEYVSHPVWIARDANLTFLRESDRAYVPWQREEGAGRTRRRPRAARARSSSIAATSTQARSINRACSRWGRRACSS